MQHCSSVRPLWASAVALKKRMHPQNGHWDDVSGESFLRKLLSQTIEEAKYSTVGMPPQSGRSDFALRLKLLASLHAWHQQSG